MEQLADAEYKVFLVEDSPMLRTRVEGMLASIPGARIVGYAEGAQEAIRAILAAAPDAVVVDLHLKEGSGFDVMRTLHRSAPGTALFVLTNHPADGYRAIAERLGARGFFDKSHEFELFRSALAAAATTGS